MPDLNDELFSSFRTEGPTVNPLPASEVRRRGDRMRRRHHTLAAVGGVAAALVVIATPVAIISQQGTEDPAPPYATRTTEAPRVSWRQEIPADLPLDAGLVGGGDVSPDPGVDRLTWCGQTAFDASLQTVDVAGVTNRRAPNSDESELTRTLALYPDHTAAAEAVDRLRDAAESCRSEAGAGGDTIQRRVLASKLPADDAFLVSSSQVAAGDDFAQAIDYLVVARTGNAVLLTLDAGTVPYDPQVTIEQERVSELVDAMAVFRG